MRINACGEQIDATPDNATWLHYSGNDLLDGLYVDIDDERYAYINRWSKMGDRLLQQCMIERIPIVALDPEIDMSEAPHTWIVDMACGQLASIAELVANGEY